LQSLDDMNTPDRLSEVLASGKTIGGGRYILNNKIGEHSNIWLAHDDVENKPSVLNFLPTELTQDPRAMDELRNQLGVLRNLSHPNVGGVYELYEAEGEESFISSEYIEGMNLSSLQQMQPNRVFSWTFLAPLLKQIFAALEFVHQNHLVQGSLKPSSLMLDRKGQIKMLEVGTAGILNNPLFSGPPQMGAGGLLPYLSPQQIDGNPPAVTDDIYSLGVTIYEFLTSTVPFNQGDILPQIRNSQPETIEQRLAKLRISNPVPPIITSMVMTCLSKDPAARPQDIQTLMRSLEVAEMTPQQQPQPAPQPEPARQMPVARTETSAVEVIPPQRGLAEAKPIQPAKKPTMAIVAALVVVLLGGGAALYFFKKPSPSAVEPGPDQTTKTNLTPDEAARFLILI
jgi:serine/threonine protein kinase